MKTKKYRSRRNPLKLALSSQGGKPLEEFTGEGEETITGEGGSVLRFMGGKYVGSGITKGKDFSHEDFARLLRLDGIAGQSLATYRRHNISPHIPAEVIELLSIPDLAILAASLIKAIHGGDAEAIHRVAAMTKNPWHDEDPVKEFVRKSPDDAPEKFLSPEWRLVQDSIGIAAQRAGGVPTREDVRDVLTEIFEAETGARRFTNLRSDKLQKMLEDNGFGWLRHRKRGEHLKNLKLT